MREIFFLLANYFKGHFEGAKTFLTLQIVPSAAGSYFYAAKHIIGDFVGAKTFLLPNCPERKEGQF
jgi:hypothetical protein